MSEARIPRVFIGLPVYNGERFVARALDSLLGQTFGDFRLLISDNASTDGTQAVCERYAAQDPRVLYHRQATNIGAPRNWNYLAEQAGGDYFKWAGANDECAPQMLEQCVAALDADPAVVLCQGRTCLVDEDSGQQQEYANDLALLEDRASARLATLCMQLALNNGQGGVIRLAALRQTRLERAYPGGDYPLMAELALLGKFIVLPEVLFFRRMGRQTFSRAMHRDDLTEFFGAPMPRSALAHDLRRHVSLLRLALRTPIPWQERAAAAAFALRRLAWDRGHLWQDVRNAVARR